MTKKQIKQQVLEIAQQFVSKQGPAEKLTDDQMLDLMVSIWQHGQSSKTAAQSSKKQSS